MSLSFIRCSLFKVLDRIFATPSIILRSSGSVGMSLLMWMIGAAVASAGTAVYLELGTVSYSNLSNHNKLAVVTENIPGLTKKRRGESLPGVYLPTT